MLNHNILLTTDSYKASHYLQYPPGSQKVHSYIESRGCPEMKIPYTTFFGLQAFLKAYMCGVQVTREKIDEAKEFWAAHGEPFDPEIWEYILEEHGGKLPVVIRAVPEGTNVPLKQALVTIENTDEKCFWLPCFLETALLRGVWYPTTVATISNSVKRVLRAYLEETSDDPEGQLLFRLHDFGARGVSSGESAMIGGGAHLVNFLGTDTIESIRWVRRYYREDMAGFSIPAAEHSTITSWGKENEVEAMRNMLKQFAKPGSLVAVVSDSFDIFRACSELWGKELKQEVLDSGATVVVRPDSGDPVEVVLEVVRRLDDAFGGSINGKGYRVLHPQIRVIQGDGCTPKMIDNICAALKAAGYSIENVAFGMGGGLLQKLDRDTFRWAMKCSAIQRDGEWIPVFKDPITDQGKISKKGRLTLVRDQNPNSPNYGRYLTANYPLAHGHPCAIDQLHAIFRDGELVEETTFAEVRDRSNQY